jgi:hypothetical protein
MFHSHSLKTTFEDVYGLDSNPQEYTGTEYTERIDVSGNENVSVHECIFRNITSSEEGGALYCNSSDHRLLIEQSSFISCMTSEGHGGGIHFLSAVSGECALLRVCAYNCSAVKSGDSYGQFAWITIKSRNHVNDSSIIRTLTKGGRSHCELYLYYANILCPSVNLSNNKCNYYTAMLCFPTSQDTCYISYSSFVNNSAMGGFGCIYLENPDSSKYIDTCNILNNKQHSSNRALIITWGNLLIMDSCILGSNKDNRVFYEGHHLYKITISNCTIDDDIFTESRYYGSITMNKSIESSFVNQLSHIVTQKCDSYFDSYGILTSITPEYALTSITPEYTPNAIWNGEWDDELGVITKDDDIPIIREFHYPLQTEYVKTSVPSVIFATNVTIGTVVIAIVIVISVYNFRDSVRKLKSMISHKDNNGIEGSSEGYFGLSSNSEYSKI